jgi:hypothetical protein
MENLFTSTRFDGHKELTQMGKLFAELEKAHNNLTSLSYDSDEDGMCFEAAVFCAKRDYAKALDNLKQHCHNMEKSNQMAGVM